MYTLGISGRAAAGKSTIAAMFAAAGDWRTIELPPACGDSVSQAQDQLFCSPGEGNGGLLVVGVHSMAEWIGLETAFGGRCALLHVEAPREVRMLRRLGWSERDAEFYAADEVAGAAIDRLRGAAAWTVSNAGSVDELARQVAPAVAQVTAAIEVPAPPSPARNSPAASAKALQ